jgi:hypothetical protein
MNYLCNKLSQIKQWILSILDTDSDCKYESKGRTVWRIGEDGKCLRCGEDYL